MKRFRAFIPLVIILLSLGACGTPVTSTPNARQQGPTASQASPQTPVAATPFELIDGLERKLVFEAPPERIVVAGRATALLADAVYLFPEAVERVAAVEGRFQSGDPFYPLLDPTFDQVTLLERNASAEQILPIDPDAVIMKSFMADSLGEPLEQVGVPVVYLDLETTDQFSRDITTLGRLFGEVDRAEEVLEYYGERMGRVNDFVEQGPSEKPSVLLAQYSSQDGQVSIKVPSASWLQTSLVQMAGGEPVWIEAAPSGGWTVVGFEQIAAWDPDKIFIVNYFDNSSQSVNQLIGDPNWASLRAVKEGEIYGFPADFLSWDQPDTRWILGLQWLTTKIQPTTVESIDIMAEVHSFFTQMYGLDPEAIEAEIIPRLRGSLP